jgi:hypothetical protein
LLEAFAWRIISVVVTTKIPYANVMQVSRKRAFLLAIEVLDKLLENRVSTILIRDRLCKSTVTNSEGLAMSDVAEVRNEVKAGNGCSLKLALDAMPSLEQRVQFLKELKQTDDKNKPAISIDFSGDGGTLTDASLTIKAFVNHKELYKEKLDIETLQRKSVCANGGELLAD